MDRAKRFLCLAIASAWALTSCSRSGSYDRQEVTGSVTFQGQPLKKGMIQFEPLEETGTAGGATIVDGKFEIGRKEGLAPGRYRVRIFAADENAPPEEAPSEVKKPPPQAIPPKYNLESNLEVAVEAGKANNFTFDLKK